MTISEPKSHLEKIVAHLQGGAELEGDELLKFMRVNLADDLTRQYGSRRKVAPMLLNAVRAKYRQEGYAMKYTQKMAYEDIADAEYIYATTTAQQKQYHLNILMDWIMQDRRLALAKKDLRTLSQVTKNYITAIEKFLRTDELNMDELRVPQMVYLFKPELLNVPMPDSMEQLERELIELQRIDTPLNSMPTYAQENNNGHG